MTNKSVFEYSSYKRYLAVCLGGEGRRTGRRTDLARHIGCQTTYISQVLHGEANLNMEQAFRASEFLGHNPDERQMFLLLVQTERAGSTELRRYFRSQVEELLQRRLVIKNRLKHKEGLDRVDQAVYYSRWHYACIHMMVTIPELQTKEAIAEYLGLPLGEVSAVLDFLESCGLLECHGDRYRDRGLHIHLGHQSENIQKHHTNWRLQALRSLDRNDPHDLHYSVVVTLARKDVAKIKERLIQTIQENLKDIEPSKEEVLYCQTMDFFEVKKVT
jgi:uncharacterized protein (TIGR02147 family)